MFVRLLAWLLDRSEAIAKIWFWFTLPRSQYIVWKFFKSWSKRAPADDAPGPRRPLHLPLSADDGIIADPRWVFTKVPPD